MKKPLIAAAIALLCGPIAPAFANYPDKAIKVIIPFAAGGGSDILVRSLAKVIEEKQLLPVPITVINVDGAGSSIGAREARNAPNDGYTYLLTNFALLGVHATGILDFGVEAFEPVAQTSTSCMLWTAMDGFEHDTLKATLEAAAAVPGSIKEAINIGAVVHISSWMTSDAFGSSGLRYVQSGGGAKRFEFLYGGHVDVTQFSTAEYTAYKDKGLKALAILRDERHPKYPDIPTAKEQGIDVEACVSDWFLAPKGTPRELIDVFANAVEAALATEEMAVFFARDLRDPDYLEGDALAQRLNSEAARVNEVAARHLDELDALRKGN